MPCLDFFKRFHLHSDFFFFFLTFHDFEGSDACMSSLLGNEVAGIGRLGHCELILCCLFFCLVGGGESQTRFQECSDSRGSERHVTGHLHFTFKRLTSGLWSANEVVLSAMDIEKVRESLILSLLSRHLGFQTPQGKQTKHRVGGDRCGLSPGSMADFWCSYESDLSYIHQVLNFKYWTP